MMFQEMDGTVPIIETDIHHGIISRMDGRTMDNMEIITFSMVR